MIIDTEEGKTDDSSYAVPSECVVHTSSAIILEETSDADHPIFVPANPVGPGYQNNP